MREVRVALEDIKPGEMIIRIGTREINSRFTELRDCRTGLRVNGPRGGAYRLTAAGARQYCTIQTYTGAPIVARTATAVVLRDAE